MPGPSVTDSGPPVLFDRLAGFQAAGLLINLDGGLFIVHADDLAYQAGFCP